MPSTRIMTAAVAREDGCSHRWNLEQHEHIHHDENDQQRKVLHQVDGVGEVHQVGVIPRIKLSKNAHRRCGDHFVKRKTEECLEPSPEKKIGLLEDDEGNEKRSKNANDGGPDCTVGDDDRDERRENSKKKLDDRRRQ